MPSRAQLERTIAQLDAAIVLSGWLPLAFSTSHHLASLRAVRAFRPLRAFAHMSGLRAEIQTIVRALPHLRSVGMLVGFVVVIWGILGMQQGHTWCTPTPCTFH